MGVWKFGSLEVWRCAVAVGGGIIIKTFNYFEAFMVRRAVIYILRLTTYVLRLD
jgi:hypothetical protein